MVSYVLVMENPKACKIKVGKLGEMDFEKGFYYYAGSANSGMHRIKRHFRKEKKIKWHIDYVLEKFIVIGAVVLKIAECRVASMLARHFKPIPRFGCSDCKCYSHLFYSPSLTLEFLPI